MGQMNSTNQRATTPQRLLDELFGGLADTRSNQRPSGHSSAADLAAPTNHRLNESLGSSPTTTEQLSAGSGLRILDIQRRKRRPHDQPADVDLGIATCSNGSHHYYNDDNEADADDELNGPLANWAPEEPSSR